MQARKGRYSCQIGGDDSEEHDTIKRAGSSDTDDSGLKCLDITEVEQVGADERIQHSRDE